MLPVAGVISKRFHLFQHGKGIYLNIQAPDIGLLIQTVTAIVGITLKKRPDNIIHDQRVDQRAVPCNLHQKISPCKPAGIYHPTQNIFLAAPEVQNSILTAEIHNGFVCRVCCGSNHDLMYAVRDEDGDPRELIGYWSNITESKRAEEELARLNKQLRETAKNND